MASNKSTTAAAASSYTPAAVIPSSAAIIRRPPPMPNHPPKEFKFAQRTLHKMVVDSDFFPMRAEFDDWFRPHDARGDVKKSDHRRPSVESTNTASTSESSTSLGGSPIAKRDTADMSMVDLPFSADSPASGDGDSDTNTKSKSCGDELSLSSPGALSRRSPVVNNVQLPKTTPIFPAAKEDPAVMEVTPTSSTPASAPKTTEKEEDEKDIDYGAMLRAEVDNAQLLKARALAKKDPAAALKAIALIEKKKEVAQYSKVAAVHEKDIDYGKILGTGGFCEVRIVTLKKDDVKGISSSDTQRYAMKYLSPSKTAPKEAKDKDGKAPRNKQFERGIADLAIEARFLTLLSHENIINMHYVSEGSLEEQFNSEGENNYYHQFGYFLLLDPLVETLAKRIDHTYIPSMFANNSTFDDVVPVSSSSSNEKSSSSSWWKRLTRKNAMPISSNSQLKSWKAGLAERLEGLKGIATGLQYLHDDCNVIYRDVKPDNIGFYRKFHPHCNCGKRSLNTSKDKGCGGCTCYTDIPQLFDFGLAKELKPSYRAIGPQGVTNGTYKLTARSGSRRYMAPEVAFSPYYNEKADVYSFGIVLYQVAALITPFEGYSLYMHEEAILSCGGRPNVVIPAAKKVLAKVRRSGVKSHNDWLKMCTDRKRTKNLECRTKSVWTKELRSLMEECWHDDLKCRPSMKDVVQRLDSCISELTKNRLSLPSTKKVLRSKSTRQETEHLACSGSQKNVVVDPCTTAQ